jgi:hypothetical protein
MELILFIGALLLLDLLAMRFGVDSRALSLRADRGWWPDPPIGDLHHDLLASRRSQLLYEARVERLAVLAAAERTPPRRSVNGVHRATARRAPKPTLSRVSGPAIDLVGRPFPNGCLSEHAAEYAQITRTA